MIEKRYNGTSFVVTGNNVTLTGELLALVRYAVTAYNHILPRIGTFSYNYFADEIVNYNQNNPQNKAVVKALKQAHTLLE